MRRYFPLFLAACLGLCLFTASSFAATGEQQAVTIPGVDSAGLMKRIEAEKGKVVVLNLFASWCPPCRKEVPRLVNIRKELPEDTLYIFGVAVHDQPRALINYMSEMHINYPVFMGDRYIAQEFVLFNKKSGERVEVAAVPMLLIFNKKGELVSSDVGLVDEDALKATLRKMLEE